jgi:hypothetical protein
MVDNDNPNGRLFVVRVGVVVYYMALAAERTGRNEATKNERNVR